MNQMLDLEKLHFTSSFLSMNLPFPAPGELPTEVAETLEAVKSQMHSIPETIRDLKTALREFDVLDASLERLIVLARESADLPEDDRTARSAMEKEFIELAYTVAQIAGRSNYNGPALSVANRGKAQAALKILAHLVQVKSTMAAQFKEQEMLIGEAITETLDFLEVVAQSYPKAASLSSIPNLLQRVSVVRGDDRTDVRSGPAPYGEMH